MSKTSSSHTHVRDLVFSALGAVLIAICSWISIPAPSGISFTLQTMGVALVCALLGGRRGTISVIIYLLLGLVGVPVFAGFSGGPGAFANVAGGYLVGFLFTALVMWGFEKLSKKWWVLLISMIVGLFACYAFGSVWFYIFCTSQGKAVTMAYVLGICVLPFLAWDGAKIAVAMILTGILRPLLAKVLR